MRPLDLHTAALRGGGGWMDYCEYDGHMQRELLRVWVTDFKHTIEQWGPPPMDDALNSGTDVFWLHYVCMYMCMCACTGVPAFRLL